MEGYSGRIQKNARQEVSFLSGIKYLVNMTADHGCAAVLTVEHLMSVNMTADHGKAALPPVATATYFRRYSGQHKRRLRTRATANE